MSSSSRVSIKWLLLLPVVAVGVAFGWSKRLLVTPKSEKEARAENKAMQARERRRLRGLPEEHDPRTTEPPTDPAAPAAPRID